MALTLGTADFTLTATNQQLLFNNGGALSLTKVVVCNTDSSPRTVTLYKVPAGGTAGTSNEIIAAQSVTNGATVTLPLSGLVLNTADAVWGLASVTSVVNISIGTATPS